LRHGKTAYPKRQGLEEWILPQVFRVEVAEWAGVLQDGLTTLGLTAALVIAQQMLEAEVARVVGAQGKHQARRQASRHGHQGGDVGLAGRKVQIQRPQVRTVDGQEVPLRTYQGFEPQDRLDEAAFERMRYGVGRRHCETGSPPCRPMGWRSAP
jgi:hypothetical protein